MSCRLQHIGNLAPTIRQPGEHLNAAGAIAALAEIETDLRGALSLYCLKELSYREIAEVLDVPIGAVMSRIHRGKSKLKQAFVEGASQTGGIRA